MSSEIRTSFTTALWSGGSTTELFIYPPEAEYAKRNFLFRISSATVELEESSFTSLPGYSRELMILEGKIQLHHEGQYDKHMKKFDVDSFQGHWKSSAKGQCTDFNLMCSSEVQGDLKGITINKGDSISILAEPAHRWNFYYVFKGSLSFNYENQQGELHAGSLLLIASKEKSILKLHAIEDTELVSCHVLHHIP